MLDLPSVSPAAAQAASLLATRLPQAFKVSDLRVVASLPGQVPPEAPASWHRLGADVAGHAVGVLIDESLLPRDARAQWPDLAGLALPADLRAALLDALLDDVAEATRAWCGVRPAWSVLSAALPGPHRVLLYRGSDGAHVGTIGLDDAGLAWAAARCAALPAKLAATDALPIQADLLVDHAAIPVQDLRALNPGDIVLLDQAPVLPEGPLADGPLAVVLRVRGLPSYRGRIAGGQLTLLATLDGTMDTPEPLPAATFDSVTMPVECQVGRLTLTLARLKEIAVGQVLDLGFDATTAVTLRVNGQVIAVGELVRIAERTGIRITDVHLART